MDASSSEDEALESAPVEITGDEKLLNAISLVMSTGELHEGGFEDDEDGDGAWKEVIPRRDNETFGGEGEDDEDFGELPPEPSFEDASALRDMIATGGTPPPMAPVAEEEWSGISSPAAPLQNLSSEEAEMDADTKRRREVEAPVVRYGTSSSNMESNLLPPTPQVHDKLSEPSSKKGKALTRDEIFNKQREEEKKAFAERMAKSNGRTEVDDMGHFALATKAQSTPARKIVTREEAFKKQREEESKAFAERMAKTNGHTEVDDNVGHFALATKAQSAPPRVVVTKDDALKKQREEESKVFAERIAKNNGRTEVDESVGHFALATKAQSTRSSKAMTRDEAFKKQREEESKAFAERVAKTNGRTEVDDDVGHFALATKAQPSTSGGKRLTRDKKATLERKKEALAYEARLAKEKEARLRDDGSSSNDQRTPNYMRGTANSKSHRVEKSVMPNLTPEERRFMKGIEPWERELAMHNAHYKRALLEKNSHAAGSALDGELSMKQIQKLKGNRSSSSTPRQDTPINLRPQVMGDTMSPASNPSRSRRSSATLRSPSAPSSAPTATNSLGRSTFADAYTLESPSSHGALNTSQMPTWERDIVAAETAAAYAEDDESKARALLAAKRAKRRKKSAEKSRQLVESKGPREKDAFMKTTTSSEQYGLGRDGRMTKTPMEREAAARAEEANQWQKRQGEIAAAEDEFWNMLDGEEESENGYFDDDDDEDEYSYDDDSFDEVDYIDEAHETMQPALDILEEGEENEDEDDDEGANGEEKLDVGGSDRGGSGGGGDGSQSDHGATAESSLSTTPKKKSADGKSSGANKGAKAADSSIDLPTVPLLPLPPPQTAPSVVSAPERAGGNIENDPTTSTWQSGAVEVVTEPSESTKKKKKKAKAKKSKKAKKPKQPEATEKRPSPPLSDDSLAGAVVLSDLGEGQARSPLARMMSKDPHWPQRQQSQDGAVSSSKLNSAATAAPSKERKNKASDSNSGSKTPLLQRQNSNVGNKNSAGSEENKKRSSSSSSRLSSAPGTAAHGAEVAGSTGTATTTAAAVMSGGNSSLRGRTPDRNAPSSSSSLRSASRAKRASSQPRGSSSVQRRAPSKQRGLNAAAAPRNDRRYEVATDGSSRSQALAPAPAPGAALKRSSSRVLPRTPSMGVPPPPPPSAPPPPSSSSTTTTRSMSRGGPSRRTLPRSNNSSSTHKPPAPPLRSTSRAAQRVGQRQQQQRSRSMEDTTAFAGNSSYTTGRGSSGNAAALNEQENEATALEIEQLAAASAEYVLAKRRAAAGISEEDHFLSSTKASIARQEALPAVMSKQEQAELEWAEEREAYARRNGEVTVGEAPKLTANKTADRHTRIKSLTRDEEHAKEWEKEREVYASRKGQVTQGEAPALMQRSSKEHPVRPRQELETDEQRHEREWAEERAAYAAREGQPTRVEAPELTPSQHPRFAPAPRTETRDEKYERLAAEARAAYAARGGELNVRAVTPLGVRRAREASAARAHLRPEPNPDLLPREKAQREQRERYRNDNQSNAMVINDSQWQEYDDDDDDDDNRYEEEGSDGVRTGDGAKESPDLWDSMQEWHEDDSNQGSLDRNSGGSHHVRRREIQANIEQRSQTQVRNASSIVDHDKKDPGVKNQFSQQKASTSEKLRKKEKKMGWFY